MKRLFSDKTLHKIDIKIFTLAKKLTKEKLLLYFSFYNWRELAKIKMKTEELLKELGFE